MSWKAIGALIALALAVPAHAQSVEDFYRNRIITILVGFTAGGGYDLYARLLGRHMGRHVPGNPAIVVQNMPGAGSLKATQFVYSVAPKDGTVLATVSRGSRGNSLWAAARPVPIRTRSR
jgi:tripartite-type tricarboxylate transporter receptor subunit TctC